MAFRYVWIGSIALTCCWVLVACPAREDGQRPRRVPGPPPPPAKVVPLPDLGQPPYVVEVRVTGEQVGHAVAQVLRRDLELSGQFALPNPRTEGAQLQLPAARRNAGPLTCEVVLRGSTGATGVTVEAFVYFRALGSAEPARTYRIQGASARDAAHRLGNTLYQLHTGRPGPFLSKIAFVAPRAGDPASRHIFAIDFDGGAPIRIAGKGRHNILPGWSPNRELVFTSFARGNPDLYLVATRSRRPRLVSARPGLNTGGAFSPDGRTIALTLTNRGNQDIHLIGRDGAIRARLTHHPKIDVSPTWSADGRRLAFVSQRAGVPQIFLLSLADSTTTQLTRGGSDNQEPDWCPRRGSGAIAYTSRRRGTYQLFVADAESGRATQLTRGPGNKLSPSWSPDCQLVVYTVEGRGLWTTTATGSTARQIYRGAAKTPDWSS